MMFPGQINQLNARFPVKSVIPVLLVHLVGLHVVTSQTIYPDGGRNVIPLVKYKPIRVLPYNDGTVMAHIIGSAGMNFLYYFHILGVSCENNDPSFYKIIQEDFGFCLNKTGSLPAQLQNQPLGSIPKMCVDWKIHQKHCYKNLAEDYDECLMNRPGLAKKGTDALRFTHAYAKFICGNIADTEAHLLDRFMKHDLVVDGVFQCFPHLQDRIVGCVKRDKISKTLCSKFYVVHACFGKYYNDDNCRDVQPIYYMDDLFRNMSTSLSCPKNDNEWINRPPPSPPTYPPSKQPKPGWGSRDEHSGRENPWPGEHGRPWPNDGDRNPFINDHQHHHHNNHRGWENRERGWGSGEKGRDTGDRGWGNGEKGRATGDRGWGSGEKGRATGDRGWGSGEKGRGTGDRGWGSGERGKDSGDRGWGSRDRNNGPGGRFGISGGSGRGSSRVIADPHANRPYPDSSWNSKPWVDVLDRGTSGLGKPWDQTRYSNQIGSRGPSSNSRGGSSSPYEVTRKLSTADIGGYQYSTTPRGPGGRYMSVSLPPAGYATTRTPHDTPERDIYVSRSSSQEQSTVSHDDNDHNVNFYSFK